MRVYTFELDTTGKCEVEIEAMDDKEAVSKLLGKQFITKNQTESNIEMPYISADNTEDAMAYCLGWDVSNTKEPSKEEMAEEKLKVDPRPEVFVEKPLVVPEDGFKIHLNGKIHHINSLNACFQELIVLALGKYKSGESYTVTYKHTQRHTDLGFKLEGSIKNNENLKMNDGLIVNIQII